MLTVRYVKQVSELHSKYTLYGRRFISTDLYVDLLQMLVTKIQYCEKPFQKIGGVLVSFGYTVSQLYRAIGRNI